MKETKCGRCGKTVILTDDRAVRKWAEEQNGICADCRKEPSVQKLIKTEKTIKDANMPAWFSPGTEGTLRQEYDELLKARKKYFELYHGKEPDPKDNVLDKIGDHYGVDLWEIDDLGEDMNMFFCMGEDSYSMTYDQLIAKIKKFKEEREHEDHTL